MRVEIQVRLLYFKIIFDSRNFKMQIMTSTNFLDPTTLWMGNKNPNATNGFLMGMRSHQCHVPHLTVIDNMHIDAWITFYPDASLSMLQRLDL